VRGSPPSKDTAVLVTKAIMMSRYHQPYSELAKMPYTSIMYFIALAEAEDAYTKKQLDDKKRKAGRGK